MKDNKKPDWLKKFEEQSKEFEDSKYGQMTDLQIQKSNMAIQSFKLNDSEVQKKRNKKAREKHPNMSSNGGKIRAKSFTSEYQSYAAGCRDQEKLKESLKKATSVSSKNKQENTKILKQKLYDLIDLEEFTVYDIEHLLEHFDDFQDLQMFRIYLRDKSKYEVVGIRPNNKPGANPKIYKKKGDQ